MRMNFTSFGRGVLGTALGFVLASTHLGHAADLGDPAAPLNIASWPKGSPVDLAEVKGKKVVVVEFWATWCGPCKASIPHLTEVQKKFKDKDVIVVGVSDEKSEVVQPFVDKMGDKMDYTVALDNGRKTSQGYMKAYNQNGIPHAFIVDKESRVVWQGHPMDGLDQALEEVVAGKIDLEKGRKRSQAQRKLNEYEQLLFQGKDDKKAADLEKELVSLDQELGGIMAGSKFDPQEIRKQIQFSRSLNEYQKLMMSDSTPDATKVAALEKALGENTPPGFELAKFKENFVAQKAINDYMKEATGKADEAKLAALGAKLEKAAGSNAQMLNQIAWTILTGEEIKKRDIPLALKIAKAALDACEGKEAAIVDTYARALFDSGKVDEAIKTQKKAIELCEDKSLLDELKANLKTYEAKAAGK